MPAQTPPVCDFGWPAPDFNLTATDGKTYTLAQVAGPNGTLIAFICNHCPYVLAVLDRRLQDARDLSALGVGVAAICSNDPVAYPADSFEKMAELADRHGFPFPYLHDPDQSVARAYDAVCTPDFFGFDAGGGLQYRGRLDADGLRPTTPAPRRDLFIAMSDVAKGGNGPTDQIPSMGCSIKWKTPL